ncbi:DUF4344 domain-containing metallopeptidase [Roseibium algae]|uniref:DUF4344 domain-containing metallopeptidase n=1 Tax=Roseibium algae TaxID=3123038 RepID=A0ABU8TM57_9HYPH
MLIATLLFCIAWVPHPARADDDLTPRMESLTRESLEELFVFVSGNILFTLYHEAGHMLVSELQLPILGQEEDAVDNLATITMLSAGDDDTDLLLTNAMIGWFLIADDNEEDLVFYGEHDLDEQRGYTMLCMMAGSDPDAFTELAADLGLPKERAETCAWDYDQAVQSWDSVTEPFLRSDTDTKQRITVLHDPASPEFEAMSILLYQSELMESVAEELDRLYELPAPVTFRATSCGEENAYWDPDKREMTLCYELLTGFAEIYMNSLATGDL